LKQELIKVTIGENGSIGRISVSFTGTQDMSLQIQDMFVTINVEKSFVNRTKLKKENSIIDEEASFSRGRERHPLWLFFYGFYLSSFALDLHQLSSAELSFNDLRMDVTRVELNEFKGIERKKKLEQDSLSPKVAANYPVNYHAGTSLQN